METFDEFDFVSLYTLLEEGFEHGVLATAIESAGIYGWDQFGRFRHYTPVQRANSAPAPSIEAILDLLAGDYARTRRIVDEEPEPMDVVHDHSSELHSWGWPQDKCPDLNALRTAAQMQPRPPQNSVKRENADLHLIGALVQIIRGEAGNRAHPEFGSAADLIRFVCDKYRDFDGISRSTLENKFAKARRLLNET